MDEWLTVAEFARRTSYARQTIYNKINKGDFVVGKHYVKPTRKKVLFRAAAVTEWLAGKGQAASYSPSEAAAEKPGSDRGIDFPGPKRETSTRNRINF